MLSNLRMLRLKKGLTQKELSSRVGISDSYYCQLETGTRRMSLSTACKIAVALNQSLDALFMQQNFALRNVKGQKGQTENR